MTWHLASFGGTFYPIPSNPNYLQEWLSFMRLGCWFFFFSRVLCGFDLGPRFATTCPYGLRSVRPITPSPLFHLLYRWLPFWFPRALFFNSFRSSNLPDSFKFLVSLWTPRVYFKAVLYWIIIFFNVLYWLHALLLITKTIAYIA